MCRNVCSIGSPLWSGHLSLAYRGNDSMEICRLSAASQFHRVKWESSLALFLQLSNVIKIWFRYTYSVVQLLQLYIRLNCMILQNEYDSCLFYSGHIFDQLASSSLNSHMCQSVYIYSEDLRLYWLPLRLSCPFNPYKRKHYERSCSLHRHPRPSLPCGLFFDSCLATGLFWLHSGDFKS